MTQHIAHNPSTSEQTSKEDVLCSVSFPVTHVLLQDAAAALADKQSRSKTTIVSAVITVALIFYATTPSPNAVLLVVGVVITVACLHLGTRWDRIYYRRLTTKGLQITEANQKTVVEITTTSITLTEHKTAKRSWPLQTVKRVYSSGTVCVLQLPDIFITIPRKAIGTNRCEALTRHIKSMGIMVS